MPVVTMPHLTPWLISLQSQHGLLERCFRWGVQTGAHEGAGTRLKRHGCCADKFLDNVLEENPKLLMQYATRREQKQEMNIRKNGGMLKQKCLKHRNTHKSFADICERLSLKTARTLRFGCSGMRQVQAGCSDILFCRYFTEVIAADGSETK